MITITIALPPGKTFRSNVTYGKRHNEPSHREKVRSKGIHRILVKALRESGLDVG